MFQNYIIPVLTITWLFLCSWQDIRRKKISIPLILGGLAALLMGAWFCQKLNVGSRLGGLSLGILLLGMNPVTRGQVGIGDGLIVCIMGLCLGFNQSVLLLLYALVGAAFLSGILLMVFHVNRKMTIPFVPFLLLGYLGVLVT